MIATPFNVFGWTIAKNLMDDGEEITSVLRSDISIESINKFMFWTKGARVVTEYPEGFDNNFYTQQRGQFYNKTTFPGVVLKRGKYIHKAVGETEYWCLDHASNDNSAPELQLIFLNAGETYATSIGELIFVTDGETSLGVGPLSINVSSENTIITAITDTSLILFSRRK